MPSVVECFAWWKDNTMMVQLGTPGRPLRDLLTGNVITTAVVTCTAKDAAGDPLTGTWPVTLDHRGSGIYRASVATTATLGEYARGTAEITATIGGDSAKWIVPILGMEREPHA